MPSPIEQLETELDSAADVAEQIRLLNTLSEKYHQIDPARALAAARRALALAVRHKDRHAAAESYRHIGVTHYFLGTLGAALVYLQRAVRLYEEVGDVPGGIRSLCNMASVYLRKSEYRKSHEALSDAKDLCEGANDPPSTALVLSNTAGLHLHISDYSRALDYYYQSLRIKEENNLSPSVIATDLHNIAIIQVSMKSYDRALQNFARVLEIHRRSGALYNQALTLWSIGSVHATLGNVEEGYLCNQEAAKIAEGFDNPWLLANTVLSIGVYQQKRKEFTEAEACFLRGLAIGNERGIVGIELSALFDLAMLKVDLGEDDEALVLLQRVLGLAEEKQAHETVIDVHRELAQLCEKMGDASTALHHHKRYVELKEKFQSQEQQNEVAEIQIRMEIETADKEREILRLKNERLELEMDHKAKELTSLAMQLVQKNEFLDAVAGQIRSLRDSSDGKQGAGKQGAGKQGLDALLREINGNRNSEGEWDQFEQQFRSIHYDFTDRLTRDYPTLSPTEVKVCALLKINLATKEIANILCCSPRTVEDHRYRIRKKLGITNAKNLSSYLAGM
jgi:tetratricopeptide (TPR) repeat protein/DNA-binding CsgD family transcriptional regulator